MGARGMSTGDAVRANTASLATTPKRKRWSPIATSGPREPTPSEAVFEGVNESSDWPRNRLLLALPTRSLKRLMPELRHVRCQREQILIDADGSLDHVYFPDNGVVSVLAAYADGNVIEMATIGREGCTGVQAVFGLKNSSAQF